MMLKLQSRFIPQKPGVYIFRSKRGSPIYIGKAANLRARLRSYGMGRLDPHVGMRSPKVIALVQEADTLSWEILNSEIEAFIREAELIKKYRPKYNILMRDDKQYLHVGFTKEQLPKIFITHQPLTSPNPSFVRRGKKRDTLKLVTSHYKLATNYIGPFTDAGALRTTLKSLRRIFPYCTCRKPHKTLCLNARIGRCMGFCCSRNQNQKLKIKNQNKACYQRSIYSIKQILLGRNKTLLVSLKKEMWMLSKERRYEEAARMRNQMQALERIFAHKAVLKNDLPSERQKALRILEQLLHKKIGECINRIEGYDISNIHGKYAYGSMVVFVDGLPKKDEYRVFKIQATPPAPPLGKGRKITTSPPRLPIGGQAYEGGEKSEQAQLFSGGNDPAMIHEVISRRLQHPEWPLPDVMLIDGGKAQLNAACSASYLFSRFPRAAQRASLGVSSYALPAKRGTVPTSDSKPATRTNTTLKPKIISLAKREEELYIPRHRRPIKLKTSSPALFELLTHIRDEAHRFAIRYYRGAHRKNILR